WPHRRARAPRRARPRAATALVVLRDGWLPPPTSSARARLPPLAGRPARAPRPPHATRSALLRPPWLSPSRHRARSRPPHARPPHEPPAPTTAPPRLADWIEPRASRAPAHSRRPVRWRARDPPFEP